MLCRFFAALNDTSLHFKGSSRQLRMGLSPSLHPSTNCNYPQTPTTASNPSHQNLTEFFCLFEHRSHGFRKSPAGSFGCTPTPHARPSSAERLPEGVRTLSGEARIRQTTCASIRRLTTFLIWLIPDPGALFLAVSLTDDGAGTCSQACKRGCQIIYLPTIRANPKRPCVAPELSFAAPGSSGSLVFPELRSFPECAGYSPTEAQAPQR